MINSDFFALGMGYRVWENKNSPLLELTFTRKSVNNSLQIKKKSLFLNFYPPFFRLSI